RRGKPEDRARPGTLSLACRCWTSFHLCYRRVSAGQEVRVVSSSGGFPVTVELLDAVAEAAGRFASRYRSEKGRRAVRSALGVTAVERREVGGTQWLPWALGQQVNPVGRPEDLASALLTWGEELDRLVGIDALSENTAANQWNYQRAWHKWLVSPSGGELLACSPFRYVDMLPRWSFLRPEARQRRRPLTPEQCARLLQAADDVPGGTEVQLRAAAFAAVLLSTGCRIGETTAMERRGLRVGRDGAGELRFKQKNGRWRTAPLPAWATVRVARYLRWRDENTLRRAGVQPLFAPAARALGSVWRPWSDPTAATAVAHIGQAAGIDL